MMMFLLFSLAPTWTTLAPTWTTALCPRAAGAVPPAARAFPPDCSAFNIGRRSTLAAGIAAAVLPSHSASAVPAAPLPSMVPSRAVGVLPSMIGKTVIVTGGNSGLGLAAATELAEMGATVVLAVRDPAKGASAKEAIRQVTQAGNIEVSALDLGDLSSVKSFAKRWGDRPCDVLMLNAGVMAIPERSFTVDGVRAL